MISRRCTTRCVVSHVGVQGSQLYFTWVQAKNVVLNVSEMEAKVREATNEDPWCVLFSVLGQNTDYLGNLGVRARL